MTACQTSAPVSFLSLSSMAKKVCDYKKHIIFQRTYMTYSSFFFLSRAKVLLVRPTVVQGTPDWVAQGSEVGSHLPWHCPCFCSLGANGKNNTSETKPESHSNPSCFVVQEYHRQSVSDKNSSFYFHFTLIGMAFVRVYVCLQGG